MSSEDTKSTFGFIRNRWMWIWRCFINLANSLLRVNAFVTPETLQCEHGHHVLCKDGTFISWWSDKLQHIQRCVRSRPWKQLLRSINMPRGVCKHVSLNCQMNVDTPGQMKVKRHLTSLSFEQMLKDLCNVNVSFGSQPALSPHAAFGNACLSVFFSLCLWADYYELARECGLKVNVFWLLVYVQYVALCLMKQDSSLPRDMSNKDKQNRCETNDTGVFLPQDASWIRELCVLCFLSQTS